MYGTYICHNQTSEWNREKCPVFPEEHSCIVFLQGKDSAFVSDGLERKMMRNEQSNPRVTTKLTGDFAIFYNIR